MCKMCVLSLAALFFLTCDFAQSRTVKVLSKWAGGIGYVSAERIDLLKTAPRHKLNQFRGQTSDSRGGAMV